MPAPRPPRRLRRLPRLPRLPRRPRDPRLASAEPTPPPGVLAPSSLPRASFGAFASVPRPLPGSPVPLTSAVFAPPPTSFGCRVSFSRKRCFFSRRYARTRPAERGVQRPDPTAEIRSEGRAARARRVLFRFFSPLASRGTAWRRGVFGVDGARSRNTVERVQEVSPPTPGGVFPAERR